MEILKELGTILWVLWGVNFSRGVGLYDKLDHNPTKIITS